MFQHIGQVKRSKYGAVPTRVDGLRFASRAEAEHYARLKLLANPATECRDRVRFFCLQPVFVLAEGITYRPDFLVVYADGRVEINDVKGFLTPAYRIKKKLMAARGLTIVEITQ